MNLRKHELIGRWVRVVRATDPGIQGLEGRVVDETRNMLIVESGGSPRMVAKEGSRFRFDVQGGTEVEGDEIRYRPEDRIKKAR